MQKIQKIEKNLSDKEEEKGNEQMKNIQMDGKSKKQTIINCHICGKRKNNSKKLKKMQQAQVLQIMIQIILQAMLNHCQLLLQIQKVNHIQMFL